MNNEKYNNDKKKFINFNLKLIIYILLFYLFYLIIPSNFYKIKSKFLIRFILPILYFGIFSFFYGYIFLFSENILKPYLLDYFKNKTLDIGIIGAYIGIISIIISIIFKSVIEKFFYVKIISKPIFDLIGFTLGRTILLVFINKNNIQFWK